MRLKRFRRPSARRNGTGKGETGGTRAKANHATVVRTMLETARTSSRTIDPT